MPKVPVLEQNQRMRPGNPTGFQSSSSARIRGDSISALGKGVSDVGSAMIESEKRRKSAEKTLAQADFKAQMVRAQQDVNEKIAQRSASKADTDKEEYDNEMTTAKQNVMNTFSEKYEGKYSAEFGNIANTVDVAGRDDIIKSALGKQKKAMADGITQITSSLNANVYNNPNKLQESILDYSTQVVQTMVDLGANGDQVIAASNQGHKALADTAVEGFINQDDFAQARNVVLGDTSHLYDAESQSNALAKINKAELQSISLKQSAKDRFLREADKSQKKMQDAVSTTLRAANAKADTPAKALKVREAMIDHANKGNLAFGAFGGLLSDSDSTFKEVDAEGSYKLSVEAYRAKTPEDYDKVLNKLNNLVETKNIDPKTAEKWERLIHGMKKVRSKDPILAANIDAHFHKLQAFTKPMDFIEKMLGGFEKNEAIKRKFEAESTYKILTEVQGMAPDQAYREVLTTYFKGTDSLSIYPGYTKIPTDSESLQKMYEWGRSIIPEGSIEQATFLTYMERAQISIQIDGVIREAGNKKGNPQGTAKLKEAINFGNDLFDMEELTKDRGDQRPLIFRRD